MPVDSLFGLFVSVASKPQLTEVPDHWPGGVQNRWTPSPALEPRYGSIQRDLAVEFGEPIEDDVDPGAGTGVLVAAGEDEAAPIG